MSVVRNVAGVLLVLLGVVAGLYVGGWLLFIGGVVDVVNGVKATPTDGGMIAWGVIKALVLAEVVGALAFWACALPGLSLVGVNVKRKLR